MQRASFLDTVNTVALFIYLFYFIFIYNAFKTISWYGTNLACPDCVGKIVKKCSKYGEKVLK